MTTYSPGKQYATSFQATQDQVDALVLGMGSVKVASADQSATTNSATLVSDTALTCPVVAGTTYAMHGFFVYSAGATADFKWAFSIPSGTLHWSAHKYSPADVVELVMATGITASDNTNVAGGPGVGNYRHIMVTGYFSATASGNVTFRFASSTATGGEAALRAAGSWLMVRPAYG